MAQPERQAREEIDKLLVLAGWQVFDVAQANIYAGRGVSLGQSALQRTFRAGYVGFSYS